MAAAFWRIALRASALRFWQHSTFHRYVRDGVYPVDWGTESPRDDEG
ncbi:MAG: hypothetical protein ACRERV_07375 [Methylococcales bacterium]